MVETSLQFKPRKITDAEFRRSNVFVAWSRKAERRVRLIGPTQYDAWLLIEFDPDVVWFCERPPIDIELMPLEGKRRPLDFWARRRSGKQFGIVLHDVALARDKACPFDLLKRSIEASKLKCEIWLASDMRSRLVYVRNLKELQPFVAIDQPADEQLATILVAHLERVKLKGVQPSLGRPIRGTQCCVPSFGIHRYCGKGYGLLREGIPIFGKRTTFTQ